MRGSGARHVDQSVIPAPRVFDGAVPVVHGMHRLSIGKIILGLGYIGLGACSAWARLTRVAVGASLCYDLIPQSVK